MNNLKSCIFLIVFLFLLSACVTTGDRDMSANRIPSSRPGMVIVGNATKADREIRVFNGYHSVNDLKACNARGDEIFAVPPLNLLQIGGRSLVFKSEEIISPQTEGKWRSNFTIPCSYMRIRGSKMASKTAVVFLKPNSRYTLYVRDLRVISGGLLDETTIRFKTSYSATNDKRRTHLGTIWADKIIDLPRVDTSGPKRIGVSVIINPWH